MNSLQTIALENMVGVFKYKLEHEEYFNFDSIKSLIPRRFWTKLELVFWEAAEVDKKGNMGMFEDIEMTLSFERIERYIFFDEF